MSLPQKSTLLCKGERFAELVGKKKTWNVKNTTMTYGFALLDVSHPLLFMAKRFADPFTRFYFEGYLQTVIASRSSHTLFDYLASIVPEKEIKNNNNYMIMSKYFEMAGKSVGVSIFLLLLHPYQIYI